MAVEIADDTLDRAFAPRAAAVYGASDRRLDSQGARIGREMLSHGYRDRVAFVNPRSQEIFGVRTVTSALESELADSLDFALIAVPRSSVADAVEDCIRAGIPVAMITSARFGEFDADGAELQRALVERATANGLRLLGPNCMGLLSAREGFHASQPRVSVPVHPGNVSVLAQSGSVGVEILDQIGLSGLGVDLWVTIGNCADLGAAEMLRYLSRRQSTRVIACYLESVGDPGEFRAALADVRAAGKHLVLLKGAVSSRGLEAAASHTGAMASADTFLDVLTDELGVIRPQSVRETAQAVAIVSTVGLVRGNIAVIAESGGHAVLAADACARLGIALASLGPRTQAELKALVPELGIANPIDMTPFARGAELEQQILGILARDPSVDCIVLLDRGDWRTDTPIAESWRATACASLKDVRRIVPVIQDAVMAIDVKQRLASAGIAVTHDGETVWRALARVMDAGGQPMNPALGTRSRRPAAERSATLLDQRSAAALLMEAGIRLVDAAVVDGVEDAIGAATRIGYPVVLKGEVTGVGHKTELGLVRMNIQSDAQMIPAFSSLQGVVERLGGRIEVQKQIVDGLIELIVGAVNDKDFGPHVMVGRGGVWAEYEDDCAWAHGPIGIPQARALLSRLRVGPPVFGGARGVIGNATAAAEQISRLSHLAAAHQGEIAEIDLNPLIVTIADAIAVDYAVRAPR